jgi:hypothetical protein
LDFNQVNITLLKFCCNCLQLIDELRIFSLNYSKLVFKCSDSAF